MPLTTCDAEDCTGVAERRLMGTDLCAFHRDLVMRYEPTSLYVYLQRLTGRWVPTDG